MDPVFNNYSEELKQEALDFFEERQTVRFEILGKKIIDGRIACKSMVRIPNTDTILDPYKNGGKGEHINIAYITGYNKAPLDSNKTAVPAFGDIYFYGNEGGFKTLHYDNASDRNLFLYLYFARWGGHNIMEDKQGHKVKRDWHEKPSQYLYTLDDPEAKAAADNKVAALVSHAKDLVYNQMDNQELMRLYTVKYPHQAGNVGLNTIKRSLAKLAEKEPNFIINSKQDQRVSLMSLVKTVEKEGFLYYKTSDNTWRYKDGDGIVRKVHPKKDRYETLYHAVRTDKDLLNELKMFAKTAEEERSKTSGSANKPTPDGDGDNKNSEKS